MKKIHLLVLKNYIGPLFMTFFISLFILLMQFLWKYIDDLVGKGLEWYIIAELLFYASSTFVPLALPLAILLSSIMTLGNLGEHYELVAMKSAGISLRTIMLPLVVLSLIISIFAFYFANNILPIANLKSKSLLYDVRKKRLALNVKEGMFYYGMDDFVIRAGKKSNDGRTLYQVMIYNHTDRKGNIDMTVADSGRMETTADGRTLLFTLYDGYNYQEMVEQRNARQQLPFQRTYFREQLRVFDLSEFQLNRTDENLFKKNYQMLDIGQLNKAIDSLGLSQEKRRLNLGTNFARNYITIANADSARSSPPDSTLLTSKEFLDNFKAPDRARITESAISSARNLQKSIEYHTKEQESGRELLAKHKVVWHKKFTLSFACFILFFIGAPLGAIIRKGGLGMPAVVSVVFFVLYYIISIIGEKSAVQGVMGMFTGMWLSSFILLPIGIFLTYKGTSDSPLMDLDVWNRFFSRITFRKYFQRWGEKAGS